MTCMTCKHWHPIAVNTGGDGTCQRFPPTIVNELLATRESHATFAMADRLKAASRFPVSDRFDHCGEWAPGKASPEWEPRP